MLTGKSRTGKGHRRGKDSSLSTSASGCAANSILLFARFHPALGDYEGLVSFLNFHAAVEQSRIQRKRMALVKARRIQDNVT